MAGQDSKVNNTWKAHGATLLISCYELGRQPIGLASPLAFLRRAGYAPATLDLAVEPFSPEKAAGALFAGISVPMHTALRLGVEAARWVRDVNPDCHICFYGLYANLNADYLLENEADSVIGGEVEETLSELVGALAASREPASARGSVDVPGAGTRKAQAAPNLEKIPLLTPRREGLPPLETYAHLLRDGVHLLAGSVEASRGCKHLCLHCPIPPVYGGRFFAVPPEIVLEDIRALTTLGARHITFADPDFLNGPGHAMRVARTLHSKYPSLTFDFTAKVEHLAKNEGLLAELSELGCAFIVTALESLSESVLENLEKGHTREEAVRVVRACRAAGIPIRPSLLAFTPWTKPDDYFELLDFVEEFELIDEVDPVQFAIRLLVPPGSDLLGRESMQSFIGEMDPENFIHRWSHPDPRMDRLHGETLAIAEDAAGKSEDPAETFARIRAAAAATLERPDRAGSAPALAPDRLRPPKLTESWFC
ncbi:MAG: CUAEP/CCAEP-tail radical SAM protein [Nitrospinota bacterium]|nr:CUAEP/CCAEP-tail radical SAM protein [Nitrospinota bacterium]